MSASSARHRLLAGQLRHRNFRRFYVGYATSVLGTGMAPVGIAFAVLDSGHGASDLGLVVAASTAAMICLLLLGGVAADRFGRRRVLLASDVLRTVSQGAFAALVLVGHPPLWSLIAASALTGAGTGLFNPGLTALTADIVDPATLTDANALLTLTRNLGVMAGPALAAGLVAATSSGVVVAADAATYAVSAVALAGLAVPRTGRPSSPFIRDLRDGFAAWVAQPWIWILGVRGALFNLFVYGPLLVLGPTIAQRDLGGAADWGLILFGLGAGVVSGSVAIVGRRPRRPLRVAAAAGGGWALPVAGLALGLPAPAIAAGAFVAGFGNGVWIALWSTALQRRVPAPLRARVNALDWLSAYSLAPVGLALAGPAASVIGARTVLWVAAGWQLVSTAVVTALPAIGDVADSG